MGWSQNASKPVFHRGIFAAFFTPSPGHIAHAQSAIVALLADLLPGLAAHARSATITLSFTFYRGKTRVHCPSAAT